MTKQIQKGFTLIELMIVVAIIGILAAIAIPQYGNYIARSQMSEAVALMAGMKTPIEDYIHTNGEFPEGDTKLAGLSVIEGGTYVDDIDSADLGTASEGGTLTATMKATGVNARITSGTLSMHRSTAGVWTCARGISGTAVEDAYIPGSCQQAAPST